MLGAMHSDWKRIKGYKDPEPPDCQSSLKEWEKSIKKYEEPEFTPENDPFGGY